MKIINYTKKFASLTFAATIGTTCLLSQNPLCHADPTTHHVDFDQHYIVEQTAKGWVLTIHMGQPHSRTLSNVVFLEPVLFNLAPTTGGDRVNREPAAVVNDVTYEYNAKTFIVENTQVEYSNGTCTYPNINVIGEYGQSVDLKINIPNVDKYRHPIWWRWSFRHIRMGMAGAVTVASGGLIPDDYDPDEDWGRTTGETS